MKKVLNIKCPFCGANISIEHYSSYNLQEEGNSIDKILNNSWIQHICKKCKNYITFYDNMIFHDMARKLMIFFFPNKSSYEQINFVEEYDYPANYTIRIVEGIYNDFKEKILIFENGLDDCAIELYKAKIISEKLDSKKVREAHIIFDEKSLPMGFVFYTDLEKPLCVIYDDSKYEECLLESNKYGSNYTVHYSLMN